WPLREVYSFTLGANEVSPLTMASAYATFASRGIYCQPYAISSVLDRNGKKLAVPKHDCTRALSQDVADAMNALLRGVITHGTAGRRQTRNDQRQGPRRLVHRLHPAAQYCGRNRRPALLGRASVQPQRQGDRRPVLPNGVRCDLARSHLERRDGSRPGRQAVQVLPRGQEQVHLR